MISKLPLQVGARHYARTLHIAATRITCARTSLLPSQPSFISDRLERGSFSADLSTWGLSTDHLGKDLLFASQFVPSQLEDYSEAEMPKASKGGYYAVQKGRQKGIFGTWAECEAATKGFAGAVYKKFPTKAQAEDFVRGDGYLCASASVTRRGLNEESQSSRTSSSSSSSSRFRDSQSTPLTEPSQSSKASSVSSTSKHGSSSSVLGKRKPDSANHLDFERPQGNKVFPSPSSNRTSGGRSGTIVVYVDGSSIGNGKTSARAGWGVYFEDPSLHHLNESRRLPGPIQTNNRAELMALIRAIELSPTDGRPLLILSDSKYSMDASSKWLPNWKRNGWKTATGQPVQNKDLIVQLDDRLCARVPRPKLEYVKAHAGIDGNEIVDRMAKYGASLPESDSRDLGKRSEAPESHIWIGGGEGEGELLDGLTAEDLDFSADELGVVGESDRGKRGYAYA